MKYHGLFFTLIAFSLTFSIPTQLSASSIATGQPEGVYYFVGEQLATIINQYTDVESELISTDGSIHNLELLADKKADFAIVQADILYRVINSSDDVQFSHLNTALPSMLAMVALFPEYTQILVAKESNINKIMSLIGKRIYIGKTKSGSYRNALDILSSHGISPKNCIIVEDLESYSDAFEALLNGTLDAVAVTSHERADRADKFDGKLKLLPVDSHTKKIIKRKFPYFEFTAPQSDQSDGAHPLFTRAVLVVREAGLGDDFQEETVTELTANITENLELGLARKSDRDVLIFKGQQMAQGLPLTIHPGSESYFTQKGFVVNLFPLTTWVILLILTLIIVALSQYGHNFEFAYNIQSKLPKNTLKASFAIWTAADWIAQRTWLITVLLVLFFLSFAFLLILHLENSHSALTGAYNDFAGRDFSELFTWIVSMSSMGGIYSQSITQNSVLGQGITAFIPFVSYGSALFLFVQHLMQKSQLRELEEQGIYVPHLSDHIIICGWNSRAPSIIREITAPNSWVKSKKVVVIAEFEEEKPLKKYNFRRDYVYYCRGISSDYDKLKMAKVENSTGSLVLADPKKLSSQNTRGLMTVIGINSLSKENHSIITELHFTDNNEKFKLSGANKIVPLDSIKSRLFTHACIYPGITDVIVNLLSLTSGQILSAVSATHSHEIQKAVVSKTYRDAAIGLRENGILLLAVYRYDPLYKHSETELDFHPTKSPYLINPLTQNDKNYKIRTDDELLLLQSQPSYYPSVAYAKNLVPCDSSSFFHIGKEIILVIGSSTLSFEVVEALLPHSKQIIHVVSDFQSGHDAEPQGNLIRLQSNVEKSEALLKLVTEHKDDFSQVTRAILFAPPIKDHSISTDHEQGIYQDDYIMGLAISLRSMYKEYLGNSNLHILAELLDDSNIDLFHDLKIAQPIPTNRIIELTLAKMAFFNGKVSEFLFKTMSFSDKNSKARLIKIAVPDLAEEIRDKSVGKSYSTIIPVLLDHNMQLLAIKKRDGRIIINPDLASNEDTEALQDNDCLFLFTKP
ncbi:MAG: TAXI family TRAP transporter solute-binding subunit [Candidatus Thiodiazotropha sp.]